MSQTKRITWIGMIINLGLTILKLIGGYLGRSQAVIADGIHSLSDILSDFIVLIGIKAGSRPPDQSHKWGHGKFETLSSLVLAIILLLAGAGMILSAIEHIQRLLQGDILVKPGWIALAAAIISIVVKEGLFRATIKIGRKKNSQVVIANAWHHRSDAFSSIATTLGVLGAMTLGDSLRILDPIAAIMVSLLILKVAGKILLQGINELLEKSLDTDTENRIMKVIQEIPGVYQPHNLKTRKIGNQYAIDIHIKVDKNLTVVQGHGIATAVENNIKKEFGSSTHISIHIEPRES